MPSYPCRKDVPPQAVKMAYLVSRLHRYIYSCNYLGSVRHGREAQEKVTFLHGFIFQTKKKWICTEIIHRNQGQGRQNKHYDTVEYIIIYTTPAPPYQGVQLLDWIRRWGSGHRHAVNFTGHYKFLSRWNQKPWGTRERARKQTLPARTQQHLPRAFY